MVIRTRVVELSRLEAMAYRQKLGNGRSGVVILRNDTPQPGLALLNRNTGEPDLAPNVPPDLFPLEAFREALELTSGLPYSSRGKVRHGVSVMQGQPESAPEATMAEQANTPEDEATVASADYEAIVKAYTNRKGELSYELLNRNLIQAAHSNPFVAEMAARRSSQEEIRDHVVLANFQAVTGNRALSLAEMHRIVALLDEVSPRSVLRELTDEIHRMLA